MPQAGTHDALTEEGVHILLAVTDDVIVYGSSIAQLWCFVVCWAAEGFLSCCLGLLHLAGHQGHLSKGRMGSAEVLVLGRGVV
jgi:fatty acid desaturase